MHRVLVPIILCLLVLSLFPGFAQNAQENKPLNELAAARSDSSETVAILPWIYEKGTRGAQKTAQEFLEAVLTQSLFFRENSFQIIPEARVTQVWIQDLGHDPAQKRNVLPTPRELLKLGEKLGVDWVITGHAVWHTRSIWIGLGPKTKSDCTVDLVIVDVKKKEVSLDARRVTMDSTAKEDPLKAATTLLLGLARVESQFFLTLPLTVVSGGPKTPREQRAVQLAIAKAIQPWIVLHPQNKKIDTDE